MFKDVFHKVVDLTKLNWLILIHGFFLRIQEELLRFLGDICPPLA